MRDLNTENLWGVDGGIDPKIQEYTASLNKELGNLPVAAPASDVLDTASSRRRSRSSARTRRNNLQWQTAAAGGGTAAMVVYEDVSKFFPVRIRPGQKDRQN